MSTNFRAIIRKGISVEEIKTALEKRFSDVSIIESRDPDTFRFVFIDSDDKRMIWGFFNDYAKHDYGIDGTLVDIGGWGTARETLIYLCETFGGYIQEEDDSFTPINFELFCQGKEHTPHDLFVNKIISTLGYDNLIKTLALFEEFKNL